MCRQKAVIDDLLKGYTKQDPPQLGELERFTFVFAR